MSGAEEKEVLLEIKDLSKEFEIRSGKIGGKSQYLHALSNVNLKVYKGETLGIIGESGCGKSTLGRCIVRLHQPTSGEILFEGEPLDYKGARAKKQRENVQMIFQDPYSSLNPRKTCAKIIEEPMIIHKTVTDKEERMKRVVDLMKVVGLDSQHVHRFPHEFSGGQRQRINIARALTLNPKLIVCDEPVSALDVSIQAQVLNLFGRLQREFGLTYVFISHDLSVVRHISDRIAIMYLGQVVELTAAETVYDNPLHPYTRALLSAIPPTSPFEDHISDRIAIMYLGQVVELTAAETVYDNPLHPYTRALLSAIPPTSPFEEHAPIVLEGDIPSPIGDLKGCPLASRCPQCTERCRCETPALREVEPGHEVACFLYEE